MNFRSMDESMAIGLMNDESIHTTLTWLHEMTATFCGLINKETNPRAAT